MRTKNIQAKRRGITLILTVAMIFAAMPVLFAPAFTVSAEAITATGKVSDNDVNLRTSTSTKSAPLAALQMDQALTIHKEIFTKKKSSNPEDRWFLVTAGNQDGYIRSDFVKDITWSNTSAVTTDELNYRTGPDTSFEKLGTTGIGSPVTLLLAAAFSGVSTEWYKVSVNDTTAYVSAEYIKLGTSLFIQKSAKELEGKSDLAKALLINPTRGGSARVVYTFTPSNCTARFAVKGYKRAKVPQGFTFTGNQYHILYGMAAGQSIVQREFGHARSSGGLDDTNIGDIMRQHAIELDHQILIITGSIVGSQDTISHGSLLGSRLVGLCAGLGLNCSLDIPSVFDQLRAVQQVGAVFI